MPRINTSQDLKIISFKNCHAKIQKIFFTLKKKIKLRSLEPHRNQNPFRTTAKSQKNEQYLSFATEQLSTYVSVHT